MNAKEIHQVTARQHPTGKRLFGAFRRFIIPILVMAILDVLIQGEVYGQAGSSSWALTSSPGAPSVSGNVTATNVSKGSGVGSLSFNSNGVSATSWEQSSLDLNKYYQFSISPSTGNILTVNNIALQYRIGDRSILNQRMSAAVYYSLNYDFSGALQVGSDLSVTKSFQNFSSASTITVNEGQTLYIRVYGWGAQYDVFGWTSDNSAVFRNRNVVISGTTAALPNVASFLPTNACSGSGTAVIIAGTNFTGATAVTFYNGQPATFNVDNATQITATLPAGATTGKISVTTPNGTGVSTENFTVNMPTFTRSKTDITCFNAGNGTITITVDNASGTYQYAIDGSTYLYSGTSPKIITGLGPGDYFIRVKDANNCESLSCP